MRGCGRHAAHFQPAPVGVALNRSRGRCHKSIEPGIGITFAPRFPGIGSIAASGATLKEEETINAALTTLAKSVM